MPLLFNQSMTVSCLVRVHSLPSSHHSNFQSRKVRSIFFTLLPVPTEGGIKSATQGLHQYGQGKNLSDVLHVVTLLRLHESHLEIEN